MARQVGGKKKEISGVTSLGTTAPLRAKKSKVLVSVDTPTPPKTKIKAQRTQSPKSTRASKKVTTKHNVPCVELPLSKTPRLRIKNNIKTKEDPQTIDTPQTDHEEKGLKSITLTQFQIRRIPVPSVTSLVFVTRVFGLAFVISGAALSATLFHLDAEYTQNMQGQLIGVGSTIMQTQQTIEASNSIDSPRTESVAIENIATNTNVSQDSQTTDTTSAHDDEDNDDKEPVVFPTPIISISDLSQDEGRVVVNVTVPNASRVKVFAYIHDFREDISLGNARKIDSTSWKFEWNTASLNQTEYRVKLYIEHEHGQFRYTDTNTYTINSSEKHKEDRNSNEATQSSESLSTTTDAVNGIPTTDESEYVPVPDVSLDSTKFIISTDAEFSDVSSVVLRGPDSNATVHMYARPLYVQNLYYLGQSTYSGVNEWTSMWDTRLVPDGPYIFEASIVSNGKQKNTKSPRIIVKNDILTPNKITQASSSSSVLNTPNALTPYIKTRLVEGAVLSNYSDIFFESTDAMRIEVYARPKNSLTQFFIGNAYMQDDRTWRLVWNTTGSPNGTYMIFPRVSTKYGVTDGATHEVQLLNERATPLSDKQITEIEVLQKARTEIIDKTTGVPSLTASTSEIDHILSTTPADEHEREVKEALIDFDLKLRQKLSLLSKASRDDDTEATERILSDIERIKSEKVNVPDEFLDSSNEYINKLSHSMVQLTLENEKILRDRVGNDIVKDSDRDNISDYDEIHLFKTDPYSADTDGDGFLDNTEIEQGFNPLDSTSEALIVYESPKEAGILRDDILTVDFVTSFENENTEDAPTPALISGKGLPNSFVTLYIFSTPVVVTVKTDEEGNWSYIFDKELEDGEHEVYVGITDNTGRIIAKSEALPFVKTAEAFTVVNAQETEALSSPTYDRILDNSSYVLFASGMVFSIGLVLMFLGFYVGQREKRPPLTPLLS